MTSETISMFFFKQPDRQLICEVINILFLTVWRHADVFYLFGATKKGQINK